MRTAKPTLTWIPPQICVEFSREFANICDKLSNDITNITAWKLWAMFPFCCIPAVRKDRRTRRPGLSQAQTIKMRLTRWRSGFVSELWSEALAATKPRTRQKQQKMSEADQQNFNVRRSLQLVSEGLYGKATQALCSTGLAPATDENLAKMRELHPPCDPPTRRHTDVPQIKLSEDDIKRAVCSMRSGAAAGPDSWKPSHLKSVIGEASHGRGGRALSSLTRLVNTICGGNIPDTVRPLFAAARLHGLVKKDGGLRPLAVGNLLRRVTAKAVMKKVALRAAAHLSPHQMGVSVPGGVEAIVHTVRAALDADPNLWCLQIDLISAYNRVSREHIMSETEANFPDILGLMQTLYGLHSPLFYGDHVIMSESGVGQGDPVAGLAWAIVAHPVIVKAKETVKDLKVGVFLADDGTFLGNREQLQQVVRVFNELGPERGLTLSTDLTVPGHGKTVVFCPAGIPPELGPDPLQCGSRIVSQSGTRLLGSPIGSEEFSRQLLSEAIQKIEIITSKLVLLEDPMSQYVLLRSTLGLSKFGYILRTTPCSDFPDLLDRFDSIMLQALSDLMGSALCPSAASQAALPVSMGGMGLRRSRDHAAIAYSASVVSSVGLIQRLTDPGAGRGDSEVPEEGDGATAEVVDAAAAEANAAADAAAAAGGAAAAVAGDGAAAEDGDSETAEQNVDSVELLLGRLLTPAVLAGVARSVGVEVTLQELSAGVTQKSLALRTDLYQLHKLTESLHDPRDRARLAALSRPKALAFLNSVPNRRTGNYLRPEQFVVVMRYVLGEPIYNVDTAVAPPCRSCNKPSDIYGHHAYSCSGQGGEVIGRHNLLRDGLTRLCSEAGLSPVLEARFLLADGRKPGDLYLNNFGPNLESVCWDVTVASVIRPGMLDRFTDDPSLPAELAVQRKQRAVGDAVRGYGMIFTVMATSNLGGWSNLAMKTISRVARMKALRNGHSISKTVANTFKTLSILLMRGNSEILLNRSPRTLFPPPPPDDYEMSSQND